MVHLPSNVMHSECELATEIVAFTINIPAVVAQLSSGIAWGYKTSLAERQNAYTELQHQSAETDVVFKPLQIRTYV